MRPKLLVIRAVVLCLTIAVITVNLNSIVAAAQSTPPKIPTDCNRACLESLIDQYLAAVVAHDPKRLPLAADVRFTENDQRLDVGDGFWGTASGIGNYKHYFADPVAQQAGFFGTMLENGNLVLMSLRLRVQLGRITEIETTFYRTGGGGPSGVPALDASGKPEPVWLEPVPAAQHVSRHKLIEIANAYFAGLEKNDGKGFYPFTEDCDRIENGAHTTNNPRGGLAPGTFDAFGLGCKAQFESGYYNIVQKIHHRRYPLVDEERGVVWSYAVFDHPGTIKTIKLTNGKDVSMAGFNRPSSIEVTEAFKIENGKIRRVEMVGSSVPYHLNPGWEGGLSDK